MRGAWQKTPEQIAAWAEHMREWHKKPINRAKFLAGQYRSWTPERRANHSAKMRAFYDDPERSAMARAKAVESGRSVGKRGGSYQLPREIFKSEHELYRSLMKKKHIKRAEAIRLVIAARRKTKLARPVPAIMEGGE